jgi:hypothetical protein
MDRLVTLDFLSVNLRGSTLLFVGRLLTGIEGGMSSLGGGGSGRFVLFECLIAGALSAGVGGNPRCKVARPFVVLCDIGLFTCSSTGGGGKGLFVFVYCLDVSNVDEALC